MFSKWFDPNKSFLSLGVVWIVIGLLTGIAVLISAAIIVNSFLVWDFSYLGFNNFIVVFKVPLGVLALIIPLVALLAANHRSEQTKEQIRLNGIQNNFSNYYKHREEFEKWLEQFNFRNMKGARIIHDQIFPNSKSGDYTISDQLIFDIESLKNSIEVIAEDFKRDNKIKLSTIQGYGQSMTTILSYYLTEYTYRELELFYKDGKYNIIDYTENNNSLNIIKKLIMNSEIILGQINKVCEFDGVNLIDFNLKKRFSQFYEPIDINKVLEKA
ncbi:hypothetical protein [Photobacterium sp. 53610]|uniref:hypothetical protein n=1 Tax=Photobacterium sp. 53610 TaxID=3102789 RepID=UPI002EDAACE4